MLTKHLIPALAAIGSAVAQSSQCSKATTTINSQAEATGLAQNCPTYRGSIVIGTQTDQKIDISGIRRITGDLSLLNNEGITSLTSQDLATIEGTFTLQNLTLLTTLTMPFLSSVDTIHFQSLPVLGTLSVGPPGITKAKSVTITDTFLEKLTGLDVRDVETLDINNNRRLSDFTTSLRTVSTNLKISANNKNMTVSMPDLRWATAMEIANVTIFSVPALSTVNDSARFDFNYFKSFSAPNLTSTTEGDISFVGNPDLSEIDLSSLQSIGGGLIIANNTALKEVDQFTKLKTVGGALKMRGNFTKIEFPALNDVKGAFDVQSTTDIDADCAELQSLESGGQVQGPYVCDSNRENANSDTDSNTDGSSDSGDDKENAATGLALNTALVAIAAFAGISMLL